VTTGVANAVAAAGTGLGAVRIDSGDLGVLARQVRDQLDRLGAGRTRIVVSGDLDEFGRLGICGTVHKFTDSSVQVGAAATTFATLDNFGAATGSACRVAPQTSVPESFFFQTTDPLTNMPTGVPNAPIDIGAGQSQSFVLGLTPSAAFAPTDVAFNFSCANAAAAPSLVGVNTLNLSASTTPVPDIVVLAASSDPGYVDIPGATGTGFFAVATDALGAGAAITVSVDPGTSSLPVNLAVCQTDPNSGACLASPAVNIVTTIAANATPSFGVFVTGSGVVSDSPGVNRVFVRFTDTGGVLRGETSIAVRTQ